MESPQWVAGNEKRFAEFIDSLGDADVVAVVSHKADLDGIISAKVLSKVIDPDILKLVDYSDLGDGLIETLRAEKVTKIIMSDLNFKKKEDIQKMESFAHLLIIDHHQFSEDFNSSRTVFMNAQGMCAAYLSYYLLSKTKEVKKWEWAVACASLSDWAWKQNQAFLSKVFSNYGENFVGGEEDVKKNAFWEFQYQMYLALIYYKVRIFDFYEQFPEHFKDLGSLAEHIQEVQREVDRALSAFDHEKKIVGSRFVWEFKGTFPVRELVINMRSHTRPDMTFVIYEKASEDVVKCSFRRQDQGEDVSILARKSVEGFGGGDGGGHKAAAGCLFPAHYLPEFLERLQKM